MTGSRTRAVQERRRSNAAGPHSRRPTRAEQLADALADQEAPLSVVGQCPTTAQPPDLVYPVRPGDDNEELRHSLRSVAANLPHRRVWIAGHRPSWVSDEVGHIPVEQAGSKWENARANRLAACAHRGVSSTFVLMNDDFFVMRPIGAVPALHRGRLVDVLAAYCAARQGSAYIDGMRATLAYLQARGIADPLSYELHVPMTVTKTGLRDVIRLGEREIEGVPHVRTLYGNLHAVGGVRTDDVKHVGQGSRPHPGAMFASTNDRAFRSGVVGQVIRARFPAPCRYERDEAVADAA